MNLYFKVTQCYHNTNNITELGYVFITRHKNADQLLNFCICPRYVPTSREDNIQIWFIFHSEESITQSR